MLDILIALGAGLGGALCGWFMRASAAHPVQPDEIIHADQPQVEDAPETAITQKSVYEVAEKLRTLSLRIAADVDEHQSRVQQVNLALTDGEAAPDPDAIVDVVTKLIQSNQTMQDQLQEAQQRIQDQSAQIETAEERAVTDALTRIRNRRAFDDFLQKCYANRHESPSTLMLLDVDHFKNFNDNFGHLAGDEVLRNVASMLQARLGEMGLVARYGGEEFAVVFEDRHLEACRSAVELARRMIGEREILFEDQRLNVTASIGLAELDVNESLEEWVERVDQGLYKAKEAGRDRGYCMEGRRPTPLFVRHTKAGRLVGGKETPATQAPAGQDSEGMGQLHDNESLRSVFKQMSDRLKIIDVSLYVMIIRSDQADIGADQRREIVTSIRAATRSLGQIGALENGDFVVCMPSVSEHAALQRAHGIRDAVERASDPPPRAAAWPTVSIGLSLVRQDDSFESILAASRAAVEDAAAEGGNTVVIGQPVVAS